MEGLTIDNVVATFRETFGSEPRVFRAPGRVNLIGEHTDYNEGFVLPFAIDRETVVAGRSRDDSIINAVAVDVGESETMDLSTEAVMQRGDWRDYVEGTARCTQARFGFDRGADLVFSTTIPIGAGLSSSAALEVSIGFALLKLNEIPVDRKDLAFAAQRAEHEFVGIRSGIMDQFTSVFGKDGNALLLDCRSLDIKYIPLALGSAVIAVCDTKVKHELASSEYNTRRSECEKGVEILSGHLPGMTSLRDVTFEQLMKYEAALPEKVFRRCRHVVSENERTTRTAAYLENSNLNGAGELMYRSHYSLRDDYEVSSPELDCLVNAAEKVEGVYGARMTGGGFGGCIVSLLEQSAFDRFRKQLVQDYEAAFDAEPGIYLFQAREGASEMIL